MTGNRSYIRAIVIDCRDPERLAVFWSQLLGSTIASRTGPYVWLTIPGDGPVLGFQRVDEPTPGKNRTHMDLAFPDPVAERERIEALGGRWLEQYTEGGFLVMADPEGNEFCVIPEGSVGLDSQGRANYLNG
ncbi:VOC family protein [Streptomyces niveus]|uniref:VOC family protein n=1 Tax=Streptomyces niveus TaxID=193462 RepID=UPI0036516C7D